MFNRGVVYDPNDMAQEKEAAASEKIKMQRAADKKQVLKAANEANIATVVRWSFAPFPFF
jgi:hypothetical protein